MDIAEEFAAGWSSPDPERLAAVRAFEELAPTAADYRDMATLRRIVTV